MKSLCVLILAMVVSAWATNPFPNPNGFSPLAQGKCYKCSVFNPQGQGFLENPDHTRCCEYYECWKPNGVHGLLGALRHCPPGTWFDPNFNSADGNPCVASKPYPQCRDVCYWPYEPHIDRNCMLFQNPRDPTEYGTRNPIWQYVGTCPDGLIWSDEACTCCGPAKPCKCMLDIHLDFDIDDYSCTRGEVVQSGVGVGFVNAGPQVPYGRAGVFGGPTTKTHLNAQVFSGVYGGCWVKKLSVGVYFKADVVDTIRPFTTKGIVSYASCDLYNPPTGSSYGIYLEGNRVFASIGSSKAYQTGPPIVAGRWYYASLVYKVRSGKLYLYVMSTAQAAACEFGFCPPPSGMVNTGGACVESRACPLDVGFTGTSDNDDEFFQGQISRVQVYHGLNIMACEEPGKKPP